MHRRTFLAGAAAGLQAARGANEKVDEGEDADQGESDRDCSAEERGEYRKVQKKR